MKRFLLLFLLCTSVSYAETGLVEDLLTVSRIDQRLNDFFPVTYNHLDQVGYFSMPSARMSQEGEMGLAFGEIHPYRIYSLRLQLTNFLEFTGNYRIFKGVEDPVLTKYGFGDFSDKGANLKLSLFRAEESRYRLPSLAIGTEDFIGTSKFKAFYVVATKVFLDQNLEVSLGYGTRRIRGFFGGFCWIPFRHLSWSSLSTLAFALEYDAIPYHDREVEPHPKGRKQHSSLNIGVKCRLWDSINLSAACIRGNAFAFTVSTDYNLGNTKGMLPKIHNPLPYQAPDEYEAGPLSDLIEELKVALKAQGFGLNAAWLKHEECQEILRLEIVNIVYSDDSVMRQRLACILGELIPDGIDLIIVTLDSLATPIQEYYFYRSFLNRWMCDEIGDYELNLLTTMREATRTDRYESELLFWQPREKLNIEVSPKTQTLFGSAKGKFKYALGLSVDFNGFIFNELYYMVSLGYFIFSDLEGVADYDRLNPSQLINVRSDIINYYKQTSITIDQAYVEKVTNWGRGWYTKLSMGLFEVEYGGVSAECLWYPVNSDLALGLELTLVKKRSPHGVDFTGRIRKFDGMHPTYRRFIGSQCFVKFYYDWKCTALEFEVKAGKFLANDWGARTQISRYFPSGLEVGFWYTYTNGNDHINGKVYHDKGIFFSVPLDIFYTKSSRTRWGYGMSAWLRDVGVTAQTGSDLYQLINQYRQ